MRSKSFGDIGLRKSRRWAQDQLGVPDGLSDICRYQRELDVMTPTVILDGDARAGLAMRRDGSRIAPPQTDIVALKRKIPRRGERAIAAAQHRDPQGASPSPAVRASSCFNMKCCTLPSAVRGRSSTKTISRGTLKRASCISTCASKSCASTELPARLITKATGT